jgi:iron complex outermembrane receptor protein
MSGHARFLLCAGVSALALSTVGARAQTVPQPATVKSRQKGQLEEVVVTAQRRTQNLQKVPIAVTSLSGVALAAQQVTSTLDLGRVVPNLFASQNVGLSSANVYYIRGLGQTESFPTFEPQVGTYVDDIYIARQNANNFALFGVSQVQVLRGPQGTLFGRNSTGGAILVTLQKPQDKLGGYVDLGYGSYGAFSGRASIDIPISHQFLTRTSVYGLTDNGYVQNVTNGQTLNANHNFGVREAFRILPNTMPNVEWNLAVDYQQNNGSNILNFPVDNGGVNGSDRIAYTGFSTSPGALEPFLTGQKSKLGQGDLLKSYGAESNLAFTLPAGTLNIITGFRGISQADALDFPDSALGPIVYDTVPTGQFALAQELRSYEYTQEVKFSGHLGDKLTYTTGVFYLFETDRDNYGAVANLAGVLGIPGLTNFPATLGDEYTRNQTVSEAVYGQADYKITPKLTLTLGGRFAHEIKQLEASPNGAGPGFTTEDIRAAGYLTHLTADEFTPRVALQYQFTPRIMGYASATRGFQGGGWNGLAFTANTFNNFAPETVWSYETGFRAETPDQRLRVNGSFFFANTKGYQLLSDLPEAASFVTANAASLQTYGAEFDITWRPIENLTINSTVGLIKGLYFDPSGSVRSQQAACRAAPGPTNASCGTGIVNFAGDLADPTYTPPVNATLSGRYDFDIGSYTLTPSAGVQFSARQYVGPEGTPQGLDPSRALLDLGLTLNLGDIPVSLTAECKNCTMVNYATTYLFGYRYYNQPGTYDFHVSYHF